MNEMYRPTYIYIYLQLYSARNSHAEWQINTGNNKATPTKTIQYSFNRWTLHKGDVQRLDGLSEDYIAKDSERQTIACIDA